METIYVIMNKGEVYHGRFFEKLGEARNYIKFKNPTRKWKEPVENTLVCAYYGTTFKIMEITNGKSLESKIREGMADFLNPPLAH